MNKLLERSEHVALLGLSFAATTAVVGMPLPAQASTGSVDNVAATPRSHLMVSAGESSVAAGAYNKVEVSNVEGRFSFTQTEVTGTDQIRHDMQGADKVLCGASEDVLSSTEATVPAAADWQITVGGDGLQGSLVATLGDLAVTGSQSSVMGCSCLGNPADGRASVNAACTGVKVYSILEAAGGLAEGANAITFVSQDGYEVTLPLAYVLQRASMIVYQINGEPLANSVGGTNQLWLGSTSARYFASDVVEIRVTCEDEAPAAPGTAESGDHAANLPNVGVATGAAA